MNARFLSWQQRVDREIQRYLPSGEHPPERLHQAIHYCLLGGGKRVRPMLVYAAAELFALNPEQVDAAAVAVEMVHTYSLIHDDLPAMDDDDLRRGRPTCHKAFDDATAILAGDGLQTLAFEALAGAAVPDEIRLQWILSLAQASGVDGMVGGQMMDLEAEQQSLDGDSLINMHQKKTGALIRASILMGAAPAKPDLETLGLLHIFADTIGLAFQVQDDILDVEGESSVIGKPQGSDIAQGKTTFVSLYGVDGAKQRLQQYHQQVRECLTQLGSGSGALAEIADFIIQRNH